MPGTIVSTLQILTYLITLRHLSLKEMNWHKPYLNLSLANIWKETGIVIHSALVNQTTNAEEILKGSSPTKNSLPIKRKLNFIFHAMCIIHLH